MLKSIRIPLLLLGMCISHGCSERSRFDEATFRNFTEEQKRAVAEENAQACNCSEQ